MPLIDTVGRLMQSVKPRRKIDGRTYRGHGTKRRVGAPLSGQFQYQITPHGIAHEGNALESKAARIVLYNSSHIARKTPGIEGRAAIVRIATIAHIHPDHIAARIPRAHGQTLDVLRIRRPLKRSEERRVGEECRIRW